MKVDNRTLLADRLAKLHCERVPDWLQARLLALVEVQARAIAAKAERQLHRVIERKITAKVIASAFLAGPVACLEEGSQGEAQPLLGPTGFKARQALASCAAKPVVGHPTATESH